MLYRDGFFKRIEEVIQRPMDDFEKSQIGCIIGEDDKFLEIIQENSYSTMARTIEAAYRFGVAFIDISEVSSLPNYANNGWLYDRKTKTFIHGIYGGHELLIGMLYSIYNGTFEIEHDYAKLAENYVLENYGCYVSRALNMHIPIKSETFKFIDEEKILNTQKIKGRLDWRSI